MTLLYLLHSLNILLSFPVGSEVKYLPAMQEIQADANLIAESGRAPRGGYGNPLQYSCLKNPVRRGA